MYRFLLALFLLAPLPAHAQTAITLPIAANAVADLGNGPIKVRMIAGNASIFTAQGSGTGSTSGSSTALTLTATPATPPLVGGLISGAGITSGTTVAAYNGTTGVTLSAAMTVAGGTTVSWGAACPSSVGSAPVIQASPQADYYVMYTQARVCAVSPGGPVNTLLVAPVFQDGQAGTITSSAIDAICATDNDSLIRLSGTWQCEAYSAQFTVGSTLSIASLSWSLITGTPTTLAGYGITNARTALTGNASYYVNGNSGSTAACGPTGASTCSAGSDSNNCLTPATACLTMQHVVNLIIRSVDVAGFTAVIYPAHGSSNNYAFTCTAGPVVGQSSFSIQGDTTAPTAVTMVATTGVAVVKDLCTVSIDSVAMADNAGHTASVLIAVGTGSYGHIDASNITFGALAIGTALAPSYGGSIDLGGANSVTASENAFANVTTGGVLNISGTVAGSASITWGTAAVVIQGGGIVSGVTGSTFTGFSGVSGPRCFISSVPSPDGVNPNSVFPGSTDCVINQTVGALGIQKGSGGSSTIDYGASGTCLKSGGGSGTLDTWGGCAGAGVPQNNLNTQSGNYSIQTTDCGNTINATGAQSTITLPSVSGFATNCVLAVYNASSTRGQILSGFPGALAAAPANILWPLDTITVQIVNGAWSLQSYPARHKITASITLFVDNTNGNDANDCLAATTSACKTRQGAFNYINTWDGNEQAILVSVAAGTYTNNLTQSGPFHGNPTVTLTGDLTTPSNVLISTTSVDALDMSNGAALTMGGFKIVTSTSGSGIVVSNASFLAITGAMEYGAGVSAQLTAKSGSTITITANYTISGGATIHWLALQGAQILSSGSRTITLSGTPAFSVAFASTSTGGLVGAGSTTFSGSATGPSFVSSTNSYVNNNPASALPGSLSTSTIATHAYATAPGTPGVSSCGTSPGSVTGTDFSGHVTEGSTATGCTITFSTGSTFNSCNVSLSTGAAVGISTLGSTLVVIHASLSGNVLYWTCAN